MTGAPGFADHPTYKVTTEHSDKRYQVRFNGELIADCARPMVLTESRHHSVFYIPKADVVMERLQPTETRTYCPFKGHASYWSVVVADKRAEDAVWAYDDPYDELPQIRDHLAFYADRVDISIDGDLGAAVAPGWTDR